MFQTFCSPDLLLGSHLFPFRTEKLSPLRAMVVRKCKSSLSGEQSVGDNIKNVGVHYLNVGFLFVSVLDLILILI